MSGWVQLHRKLLENPVFKNPKLLQTFLYCLLKATHTEREQLVGDTIVKLQPGQMATGRRALSQATGLTEQNIRTALDKLKKLGILTSKPTTKYSIISITNWDSYQQTNQQVTNNQPTSNQQTNHKQELLNNYNNGKKKDNTFVDSRAKPTDAQKVFQNWQTVMNHKKAKLDAKRTKLINGALKIGYSVSDLKTAIQGCSMTPHNMGQNDRNERFDGLHVILKPENIDRFIANGKPQDPTTGYEEYFGTSKQQNDSEAIQGEFVRHG